MRRVVVIGPPGAGKSVFSRRLSEATGLPHAELDDFRFDDRGAYRPIDEWQQITRDLVSGDSWILDGVYIATLPARLDRADTVVVLQPGRLRCLKRWVWREARSPEQWLKWRWRGLPVVWKWSAVMMPRITSALEPHRGRLDIHHFTTTHEVRDFLARVKA